MELATIPNREYVMDLADASLKQRDLIGSKAAHLGELSNQEYRVPKGFILTTAAYEFVLESENLGDRIAKLLDQANFDDAESLERTSELICEEISEAHLENKIFALISEKYQEMNLDSVAIRSSATAEDLPESSFAGQYETFLNIRGQQQIASGLIKCYQSMWSPRVISYRQRNGIDHLEAKLAILIQETVNAKAAGVLFTKDPTSSKSDRVVIESNFGLGESVVSGQAIPDRFVLEEMQPGTAESFRVKETQIGIKSVVVRASSKRGESGIKALDASSDESETPSITNHQAVELAQIGKELESIFGAPQDIEWAIDEENQIC
ncbi:MAG: PEP/pyruvate-binding domain-containing protein, partial [Candidatus Thorarchaeota archaeon]|nr:PEP/pyruvate-binding domain-containing protein [Candidatus Thorarchaeota archaeon]